MTQHRPATDARTQRRGPLVPLAVAADEIGVSTKTIRRRIADGTVTGYRVGRLIRVDLDELRRALVIAIPSAR
jgi:excisionase family DNA binding protein